MAPRDDDGWGAERSEVVLTADAVNEQVVIAAAMVDAAARASLVRKLRPDQFLVEAHRPLWAALEELQRRGLAYDHSTLQRLAGGALDLDYVASLADSRPELPTNLQFHLDGLLWDKQRATAAEGPVASLLDALKNPAEAPERVRALARSVAEVFDGAGGAGHHLVTTDEVVRGALAEVDKRIAGHGSYPYGVPGLDYYEPEDGQPPRRRMIPGAAPGQITLLTAVSGGGKTTFAAHLALGLARQRRKVLYGAWEVQAPLTLELLACISLGWSRSDLQEGRVSPDDRAQLEVRMRQIGRWVKFMRNPFRRRGGKKMKNADNLDVVQAELEASGCDVFIADLWKRCLSETRPDDEEEALFRQQAMLEELGVHGILLHQQLLKGEASASMRPDKRPTREGVKGSGAWTEVADTILAPHRPALWKPAAFADDTMELFVLKQRYGKWPLGVAFDWDPEFGSVANGRSIPYDAVEAKEDDTTITGKGWKAPGARGRRGKG